jgi:formate-dependent nitrite reductase membrane component NrfD
MSGRPDVGATAESFPRPVIKPPVWTPEIPMYFYTGGLAGGSAGLALLSEKRGEHGIARRAWLVALAGSVVSPALLISDLGMPRRFMNMLRMFKVTSPMSVGSWVLAAFGTATAPAALHALTGGALGRFGRAAQVSSAVLGLPLSSYTGALIANTAVPVWHDARVELPFLFCAGAAASAGAAATALAPVDEAQAARRLTVGGALAEIAIAQTMERRLSSAGVGEPYHEGATKHLNHAATVLTLAGAAVVAAAGRRSRAAAVAGGLLVTAGAVAERWTVFRAGHRSAERPQDTVAPQRARIDRGEARGAARREPRVAARAPAAAHDGLALRPPATSDGAPGQRAVTPGSPAIPPK